MTNEEAKFRLGAYRPDGQDAVDPAMAEALEQAKQDPALKVWLEQELAFDQAIAQKLRQVEPPAELRERIFAGSKVSQPTVAARRRWWAHPLGFALAAAIAIVAGVFSLRTFERPTETVTSIRLAQMAIDEVAKGHADADHDKDLGSVGRWFVDRGSRLGSGLPFSPDELKRVRCREVILGQTRFFEVCFVRDDKWYHVYLRPRQKEEEVRPRHYAEAEGMLAAVWSDSHYDYVVVSEENDRLVLDRVI